MIGRRMGGYKKGGIGGIDANTLLMLHGEDFTDSSMNNFAAINDGASINDNGHFQKCLFMNSTNRVKYTMGSALLLSGDFTIDCWIKTLGQKAYSCICDCCSTGAGTNGFWFECGYKRFPCVVFNKSVYSFNDSMTLIANVWHHVAFVRSSGIIKLYKNGVYHAQCSLSAPLLSSSNNSLAVGNYQGVDPDDSTSINGYIDELRISTIARWTANFTPPDQPYS